MSRYQLLPDLSPSEYHALKADIAQRGVLVPVEVDERGHTLDGHHRLKAVKELGITDYPKIVRSDLSREEKEHHVLALNLKRRHLGPVSWGRLFERGEAQCVAATLKETAYRLEAVLAASR